MQLKALEGCALLPVFYAALIIHESDFPIAKEKYLLPTELRWPEWRAIVDQLDM